VNSLLEDATRLPYEAWELADRKRDFEIELKSKVTKLEWFIMDDCSAGFSLMTLFLSSVLERRKNQTLR